MDEHDQLGQGRPVTRIGTSVWLLFPQKVPNVDQPWKLSQPDRAIHSDLAINCSRCSVEG